MKWTRKYTKIDKLRYSIISTLVAFVLGLFCYTIPIAAEHIYFFISAPIATFFPSYFIWKWTFKTTKDYKIGNVLSVGLILTLITHYLNFVVLGIGRILCYFLTGNCTDYTGQTESFLGTLTYISWLRMLISLYYFGLVTLVIYSAVGFYVIKTTNLLDNNSQTETN
jgi:hypothetical protein